MKSREELVRQAQRECGDITVKLSDGDLDRVINSCRDHAGESAYDKLLRYLDAVAFDRLRKINGRIKRIIVADAKK